MIRRGTISSHQRSNFPSTFFARKYARTKRALPSAKRVTLFNKVGFSHRVRMVGRLSAQNLKREYGDTAVRYLGNKVSRRQAVSL